MKILIKKLLKEGLQENNFNKLLGEVTSTLDFDAFKMNETLNPEIWVSGDEMKEDVLEALKKIAMDYWEGLELEAPLMDITLTGSLANFNWSKYSDADLHMVFDDKLLGDDKTMVKGLLDTKTRAWNLRHDITVKDFDVELYLQPDDQEHHSTAVYSLINKKWVVEPKRVDVTIDKETITKKYNTIVKSLKEIKSDMKDDECEDVIKKLEKLNDRIKKMRESGLETGGEFSSENIIFKLLRRNDILEQISDMLKDAYDKSVSLD